MQSNEPQTLARLRAIFRIGERLLAATGALPHALGPSDQIRWENAIASKPYIGTALGGGGPGADILLALHFPGAPLPASLKQLDLVSTKGKQPWASPVTWNLSRPALKEWQVFIAALPPLQRKRIWYVLTQCVTAHPELARDPVFLAHVQAVRAALEDSSRLLHHYWILPRLLYAEMYLPQGTETSVQATCNGARVFATGEGSLLKLPDPKAPPGMERFVAVLAFSGPLAPHANGTRLTLTAGTTVHALVEELKAGTPIEGQVLVLLQKRDAVTQQRLRELFSLRLLALVRERNAKAAELIALLQHYLHFPHTSVTQADQPFGINIEQAIPLPDGTVFTAGWMRDPEQLVEQIRLVSDLGPALEMKSQMIFYDRPDAQALFKDVAHIRKSEVRGFVAICQPQEKLPEDVALHSFRVDISLKGGLEYIVTPPTTPGEITQRRNALLQEVAPLCLKNATARNVVYRALAVLQHHCATQAKLKDTHLFGTPPAKPETSLVIPLYKNLDYLKTQYALLASDPDMEKVEVIYVLDAPELEETVRVRLKDLFSIYQLPVTLAVMEQNAGYAGATNLGAELAKGKYLVLLNADVVPKSQGWVQAMQKAYAKDKHTGALGVKLLYEDDSIQHAGMYFALSSNEEYAENRHYCKGYPAHFPASRKSRAVPAVTGACLMISRELFEKMGRLSTDYIIGDFEDSELCLKLSEAGYTSHYLADVELYHFERSSMPDHDAYLPAVNFDYNARLHYARWKTQLHSFIKQYATA